MRLRASQLDNEIGVRSKDNMKRSLMSLFSQCMHKGARGAEWKLNSVKLYCRLNCVCLNPSIGRRSKIYRSESS